MWWVLYSSNLSGLQTNQDTAGRKMSCRELWIPRGRCLEKSSSSGGGSLPKRGFGLKDGAEKHSLLTLGDVLGIACRPETIPWVKEGWVCLLDCSTDTQKTGPLPVSATHGQPCSKWPSHHTIFTAERPFPGQLLNHQLQFTGKAVFLSRKDPVAI